MMHRLPASSTLASLVVLASLSLLLTACQGYDFKVNETVVYSPDPLFRQFSIPDVALRTCLEQAIVDGAITAAEQLNVLNCGHAGIESVEGLGVFTGIVALRLSSNQIRNLVALHKLSALEELYLDNNQIVDPVPLYSLSALRLADISGNAALQCPRLDALQQVEKLTLPTHCQ